MILSIFYGIATFFLTGVAAILPTSTGLPTNVGNALDAVASGINQFSYILPVDDIFGALKLVLIFEIAVFGFRGAMWIWHKVPFIGK